MELPGEFLDSLPLAEAEKSDFIASLHSTPPVSIRINKAKSKLAIPAQKIPWISNGYYLEERPRYTSDPALHAGGYYPQEASSMFLSHIIKSFNLDKNPIKALDLCAAPGGKSTILRTDLHPSAYLVVNEVIKSRANLLEESLIKWGKIGYSATSADPSDFGALPGFFDLILVDAPCSGEGLFRKQENAVEQWSPKAVEMCAARQKRILSDIWPALAPGGKLIYSTCTYNRKENEENLSWLKSEYNAETIRVDLPENSGVEEILEANMYGYRFMPHRTKGEGLFVAILQKPEGRIKKLKPGQTFYEKPAISAFSREDQLIIADKNHQCFAIQPEHLNFVNSLSKSFYKITPGVPVGKIYGKKFKPDHGLSQLIEATGLPEKITLSSEDAIRYLEKNDVAGALANQKLVAVYFDGFRLGFAKAQQKRLISQYPLSWRIRHGRPEMYSKIVEVIPY